MAFGQLTHREGISDTVMYLKANVSKLYHLGIGKAISKSTLTRANTNRSYLIYQDLAMLLITESKQLYINDDKLYINLKGNVFAIDATIIELCLSTFWWATFRSTRSGIKLHTQIDLKTSIPEFIFFSNASVHDVNALNYIAFESGSFYIMDRNYMDYKRLHKLHMCDAYFVTRAKDDMNYRRLYSHPKDVIKGVIYDQTIMLNNHYAAKYYPGKLRRIKFKNEDTGKVLIFLNQ